MPTNILLADDHSIIRSGIKALIKDHLITTRVDEAADEQEIVKKVKSFSYDLILLDINMPGSDFVTLMNWLKVSTSQTPVLVFTTHTEDIYGKRCLQLGAKGYLHKTALNEEIIFAISKVLEGGYYINPALKKILSRSEGENETSNPFHDLSSRELEVALLINRGQSLPDICTILNIQYSTANTHKRRIFEKLNVRSILSLSRLMQLFNIES